MAEVSEILAAREKTHGKFSEHADIAQDLKLAMRSTIGWSRLTAVQAEALEMITHKIARILNGDPKYLDSARDIIGYAQLMLDSMATSEGATDAITSKQVFKDGKWEIAV